MDARNAAVKNKRFIIVVDSNVDDRFHTSMLLQRFGYNICSARTADEAIEFMCVAPPAGVIAEGGPAGSGLLSRIKKDPRFSDVPLILLSSSPNAALEDRARRGEFAACLKKPVDAKEIYRAVETFIEKGPRRNIRIATSLRARLEDEFGGTDEFVTVLSEYGMFFRTLDPRPVNTNIPVSLDVKGRTIKLEAIVLYNCSFDEGPFKEPGMGMKFVKISPENRDLIKAFILERLEEGIARQGR